VLLAFLRQNLFVISLIVHLEADDRRQQMTRLLRRSLHKSSVDHTHPEPVLKSVPEGNQVVKGSRNIGRVPKKLSAHPTGRVGVMEEILSKP
jgi:hypothetical protein